MHLRKGCQLVRTWNKRMIFLYKNCLYNKKQAYMFLENYQRTFKVILYLRECNIITGNNDHGWNLITTLAHRNNTNGSKTKGTIFGQKMVYFSNMSSFKFASTYRQYRFYKICMFYKICLHCLHSLHCLLFSFNLSNSYWCETFIFRKK